jgi:hypothetical protein
MKPFNPEGKIFELDEREGDTYKGVFFAEFDNDFVCDMAGMPPMPKEFVAGVMALIWIDKDGEWQMRGRTKFPSGSKQVYAHSFGKDSSVEEVITFINKLPLKNQLWTPSPNGTVDSIVKIMRDLDMVESERIEKIEKE